MATISNKHCVITSRSIREGDRVVLIKVGEATVTSDGDVDVVQHETYGLAHWRSFMELLGVPRFEIDKMEEEHADNTG